MKVLIIGSGGREHALAWKLAHESPGLAIVAAPGNPGIAELARCVPVAATDLDGLVALAEHERPDFTLVGPEAPLALGVVDRFRARGLPIFGPTRAAATIETSKAFAKQLMLEAGVPTAMAHRHTEVDAAKRAAREFGAPVVIKASGLAAGKGVIVCSTLDEADRAIDYMLRDEGFGAAGAEILVEEFMEGEELSVFAITDGVNVVPLVPAQDHKRLLAGDGGPNTGGMGAYAPVSLHVPGGRASSSSAVESPMSGAYAVVDQVVAPTLDALRERGAPFTGLLYAGVMVTRDGPKVVEFNCRFGDPETQAVLPITGIALAPLFASVARGETLAGRPDFSIDGHAVTTVLASAGYPEKARTGDPITIPDSEPDVHVFHAGTARDASGRLVTAGGRVLAVTAVADSIEEAQRRSTSFASRIEFDGKQYRSDIGWREIARRARAT
ncbi:MAG TPA: phosphoribosylamine--glycine ligase [Gemmatimonadaceae bacterium]|nr:phosphoribosylamine--glycine ligase [Gemmatimonadaceae bacterium]